MKTGIIGKTQKWWEKGLQPNMKEVKGAQDLGSRSSTLGTNWSLLISFPLAAVAAEPFIPRCHNSLPEGFLSPIIYNFLISEKESSILQSFRKNICQLAEMNPEHKSMCYSLDVHVLPFFRFYRGAHGRLCSFNCTNATIKKFKDELAKHSQNCCSLGPPKGLEKKELIALAANKDLSFKKKHKLEFETLGIGRSQRCIGYFALAGKH